MFLARSLSSQLLTLRRILKRKMRAKKVKMMMMKIIMIQRAMKKNVLSAASP